MPSTSADTSWLASARATADASRRINRSDLLDRGDKAHHLRHPAYGASKAALDGVCRYVGKEAAPRGVRVNVVMSWPDRHRAGTPRLPSKTLRRHYPYPLGRQGNGWDIAHAATFPLSDEASYATGQTLAIDGGLTALA